jgi:hypothetical protein
LGVEFRILGPFEVARDGEPLLVAPSRPSSPAPRVLEATPGKRLRLRRGGFTVRGLAVTAPGRLTVELRGRRLLAKGARTVSAGRWSVRARLTRRGRKSLRHRRRVKAVLVVRFAPQLGAPVQREANVILRR